MWCGAFHESKADNTTHRVQYEGTFVESYFSPTDLVAFEVWNELTDADETVHLDVLLDGRTALQAGGGVHCSFARLFCLSEGQHSNSLALSLFLTVFALLPVGE